jgi:acetate kinase
VSGSILAINAGSSSLKFALFENTPECIEALRGEIEETGAGSHFHARDAVGNTLAEQSWPPGAKISSGGMIELLLNFAGSHLGNGGLAAVGHRIVHGGADHIRPALVTPKVLLELEALTKLDPLHMPHNLEPLRIIAASRPGLPQIACFDTAFHHTMPPVARNFALPRALTESGVRRYGFHGLSFEYIAGQLRAVAPALAAGKIIVAHLGAGASLCALDAGASIATTTGFSVLDGLSMATRCGRIDPGVLLYLGGQGKTFGDIEDILYHRSGLLGVSGISGDIRTLLASPDPRAAEAIDMFTYNIAWESGALASALGGLDGFVFTAGIGEHAQKIRAAVCARLAWLGLDLDEAANAANAANAPIISAPGAKVEIRVIPTDEEAMIAQHTRSVLEENVFEGEN